MVTMEINLLFLALISLCITLNPDCQTFQGFKEEQNSEVKVKYFLACIQQFIEEQNEDKIQEIQKLISTQEQHLFIDALDAQIKKLGILQDYVTTAKSTCEPVLKWAQNMTHVLIAAKLSHRWDSPPCLKSIAEKYQLTNSTFIFSNLCLMNNVEINFFINQQLFSNIIGELNIRKDGVGTYSIIITKQEHVVWPVLFKNGQNLQLWEQILQRDTSVKDKYFETRKIYFEEQAKLAKSDN